MNKRLSESTYVRDAIPPADCDTTLASAAWYPMDNARKVMAIATGANQVVGRWLQVRLRQAEDAVGTGDEPLGDWVRVTAPAAGGEPLILAEAQDSELDLANDCYFVGVELESSHSVDAGCVLVFGDLRYNPTE